jgi:hypothetical protein
MILTIGPGGSGLTFLTWSIIFLRGDITYTSLDGLLTHKVDIDPLQGSTAHNFYKDHIHSSNNLCQLADGTKKSVVFITPTSQKDLDHVHQIDCKKIVFDCQERNKELFARMATLVPCRNIPDLISELATMFGENVAKQTLLECSKMFTHYYKIPTANDQYFIISYDDIFKNLDQQIVTLFLFLELPLDQGRFYKWKHIYKTYQDKNCDLLSKFAPAVTEIPNSVKIQVLKEILRWKNGSYRLT